ncbi:MAG: diacylglycerol/lipid kinase family protein [Chloroflexota bacterium]
MPSTETLIITNPNAGRGRAARIASAVAALAGEHGVRCRLLITTSPAQARTAAQEAAASGAAVIAAVGGDGTIHHVAAGIVAASANCALLPIPAGQGNDTLRSLGVPRDWRRSAALLWTGTPRPIDVLRVHWPDGQADVVVNVLSAGFDTEIAARARAARHVHGSVAYLLAALQGIRQLRHRHLIIDLDGQTVAGAALFVAVGNGAYYGGGMQIAPRASMHDGKLDVALAGPLQRLDALRTLPLLYSGRHTGHPLFSLHQGTVVRISGEPAPVQIDGEAAAPTPLTVAVLPQALQVLQP